MSRSRPDNWRWRWGARPTPDRSLPSESSAAFPAEWKTWRGGKLDPFVRLDISAYPTLSGGAALNADGNLIGLVSTGLSRSSVFAVTRSTIDRIAGKLSQQGYVSRGFLGVALQPVALPPQMKEKLGQDAGIMLLGIEPEGPAAVGGLIMGDVLVSARSGGELARAAGSAGGSFGTDAGGPDCQIQGAARGRIARSGRTHRRAAQPQEITDVSDAFGEVVEKLRRSTVQVKAAPQRRRVGRDLVAGWHGSSPMRMSWRAPGRAAGSGALGWTAFAGQDREERPAARSGGC